MTSAISSSSSSLPFRNRRFIDIAINLTDCVFFGVDRKGKKIHESDIDLVIERAIKNGVDRMIITGTDLEVSSKAITMCRQYPGKCFCTVGIHPAHCDLFLNPEIKEKILAAVPKTKSKKDKKSQQAPAGTAKSTSNSNSSKTQQQQQQQDQQSSNKTVTNNDQGAATSTSSPSPPALLKADPDVSKNIISQLRDMISKNRDVVVAVGECGLDYAELSPVVTPELQAETFQLQASLAKEMKIPLLLHSRDCGLDFLREMKIAFPEQDEVLQDVQINPSATIMKGVTHSFNGPNEELSGLLAMKSIKNYFGVNASAFRDEAIAKSVAKLIPEDRLMIETDAPWCDPRPGDWGYAAADKIVLNESPSSPTQDENNNRTSNSTTSSSCSYNLPPSVDKTKFELGKRVNRRNEPCTLPAVFAELCYAKGIVSLVGNNDGDEQTTNKEGNNEVSCDKLADRIYQNVMELFFEKETKSKKDHDDDDQ